MGQFCSASPSLEAPRLAWEQRLARPLRAAGFSTEINDKADLRMRLNRTLHVRLRCRHDRYPARCYADDEGAFLDPFSRFARLWR